MKNNLLALILLPIVIAAALQLCGCSNEVRTNRIDYDQGATYVQLLDLCNETMTAAWQCVYLEAPRTDTDRAICRARAYEAAEWEVCADAAHQELACMNTYFNHRLSQGDWCADTNEQYIVSNMENECYTEFWVQQHTTDCPTFW
jgi:hypothetical protein